MKNVREWDVIRLTYGLSVIPLIGYVVWGVRGFLLALLAGVILCVIDPRPRTALRDFGWYRWCLASAFLATASGLIAASLFPSQWVLVVWALVAVFLPFCFVPFFSNSSSQSEVTFRRG